MSCLLSLPPRMRQIATCFRKQQAMVIMRSRSLYLSPSRQCEEPDRSTTRRKQNSNHHHRSPPQWCRLFIKLATRTVLGILFKLQHTEHAKSSQSLLEGVAPTRVLNHVLSPFSYYGHVRRHRVHTHDVPSATARHQVFTMETAI